MKVIDLLNKIANREEVPKKIEYEGEIYEFNKNIHGYWGGKNKDCFRAMVNWRYLNNEVEILEEKKIPEKLGYFDLTKDKNEKDENGNDLELHYTGVADTFDNVYEKINEIIDYIDYLESKGE